jgi:hypothetical protein|tara:strand:- start:865 stop:1050 length:186 start_codon:yes stop_codon:yes gene_type:complete
MAYNLQKLELREIRALRKSLNYLPISGIDALFIATLQNKLDIKIGRIEEGLENIIEPETKK